MTKSDPVDSLREICMSLPEVTERLGHGTPMWFLRGEKQVAQYWCAAVGVQEALVKAEPKRFFRP